MLVITLQGIDANVHSFLSSSEVLNVSSERAEVSVVHLVRLDFGSVGVENSVSDTVAELAELVGFLMLDLDSLVFSLLSGLSLLFVGGVLTEAVGV
jgi:hypothetical protein